MNAVSTKSAAWFRLVAASAAAVWALEAPGCSGTVVSSHASRANDGGGVEGPSGLGGSGNPPIGRAAGGGSSVGGKVGGGTPGGPLCGNGVVDATESCDGANLQGETCYSVTMGSSPYGTLSCTSCIFDLSGCYGGGVGQGGFAGGVGIAGAPATGGVAGMAGMMGVDPVAVCYANGGVPDPSNPSNCTSAAQATGICQTHYVNSRPSTTQPLGIPTCASGCGCSSCASQYDACATRNDCVQILDCVERTNCAKMVDCYQPTTCQTVIDAVGGQRSQPAITMSNVLSCMASAGCTMSCATMPAPAP